MSSRAEYDRLINNKWKASGLLGKPVDPALAIRGCRALYRKAMGKPWTGKVKIVERSNGRTWTRRGVLWINPNRNHDWRGWSDMTHDMAHLAHWLQRPRDKPHSDRQAILEAELTNYVLSPAFAKYRGE